MPADAPNITYKDIEQYLELEEGRKRLEREARALGKQSGEIADKLLAFARAHGGKAQSILRSGYVLAVVTKPGTVEWKKEFVRQAGLDAAEALIAAAPTRESLSVEKAA